MGSATWGRVMAMLIGATVMMSYSHWGTLLFEFSAGPSTAHSIVDALRAIHPLPSMALVMLGLLGVCMVGYGACSGPGLRTERSAWLKVVRRICAHWCSRFRIAVYMLVVLIAFSWWAFEGISILHLVGQPLQNLAEVNERYTFTLIVITCAPVFVARAWRDYSIDACEHSETYSTVACCDVIGADVVENSKIQTEGTVS